METYHGHVRTPADAILLFEACRIGLLPRVQRRLSEKERQQIKSGSVFVWDEREAGMRRWTDGKSWSASRVSGSFLTYREMEGKRGGNGFAPPVQAAKKPGKSPNGSQGGDSDEDGPDGYRYKPDGLMKQSFSITTQSGQHLHLISYYARAHSTSPGLNQPSQDPSLRHIRPPKNMYPETTVNENANVPAVTRGPMVGSPYAPAPSPHQVAMGSPYNRPGPPAGYVPAGNWPPTPTGTPPYQYAYYPPQGHHPPPGHSPMHYGYPPQHAYAHHPPGPTVFDRPPPPMGTTALPPPPPTHISGPPTHQSPYVSHPPQYIPNPSPRTAQASQLGQHPPPLPPTNGYHHPHHQIDPRLAHQEQAQGTQGPQLPALTGTTGQRPQNKPPSPQPAEQPRSQNSESLRVPEANGTTNAPSPARTIPSVGSLLNSTPIENGTDGRSDQSNSRSGSKSPNGNSRGTRDIPGDRVDSHAADQNALRKLNSVMLLG